MQASRISGGRSTTLALCNCFGYFIVTIDVLTEMVSIGTLLAFVIVCAGVWIIRRRRPDLERPFREFAGGEAA